VSIVLRGYNRNAVGTLGHTNEAELRNCYATSLNFWCQLGTGHMLGYIYMRHYKMSIFIQSSAYSLGSLRRTPRIVTDRSVDNTIPLMLPIRLLLLGVAPFWFVERSTNHSTSGLATGFCDVVYS
jgi:hypothetical protein